MERQSEVKILFMNSYTDFHYVSEMEYGNQKEK